MAAREHVTVAALLHTALAFIFSHSNPPLSLLLLPSLHLLFSPSPATTTSPPPAYDCLPPSYPLSPPGAGMASPAVASPSRTPSRAPPPPPTPPRPPRLPRRGGSLRRRPRWTRHRRSPRGPGSSPPRQTPRWVGRLLPVSGIAAGISPRFWVWVWFYASTTGWWGFLTRCGFVWFVDAEPVAREQERGVQAFVSPATRRGKILI